MFVDLVCSNIAFDVLLLLAPQDGLSPAHIAFERCHSGILHYLQVLLTPVGQIMKVTVITNRALRTYHKCM